MKRLVKRLGLLSSLIRFAKHCFRSASAFALSHQLYTQYVTSTRLSFSFPSTAQKSVPLPFTLVSLSLQSRIPHHLPPPRLIFVTVYIPYCLYITTTWTTSFTRHRRHRDALLRHRPFLFAHSSSVGWPARFSCANGSSPTTSRPRLRRWSGDTRSRF